MTTLEEQVVTGFVDYGVAARSVDQLNEAFCQLAAELAPGDILDALRRCPVLDAELTRYLTRRSRRAHRMLRRLKGRG